MSNESLIYSVTKQTHFKVSPCCECCILFLDDSSASEFYAPTFRNIWRSGDRSWWRILI